MSSGASPRRSAWRSSRVSSTWSRRPFRPNKNRGLLSDFQNTLRDFLHELTLESFLSLHGNVNLVDRQAFRFEHSVYSVVTEPSKLPSAVGT